MNDNISALTRRLESENVRFSTDDKSLFDASLDHMRYSFLPDVVAYAECGEDIGVARLKARPVTTLCVSCKARQEEGEDVRGN